MTLDQVTDWFFWIFLFNILLFATAAIAVVLARDWMVAMHQRMFGIEREALHRAYFAYLATYKLLILVFVLVPYLALLTIR